MDGSPFMFLETYCQVTTKLQLRLFLLLEAVLNSAYTSIHPQGFTIQLFSNFLFSDIIISTLKFKIQHSFY
jgi:hypothetical protein